MNGTGQSLVGQSMSKSSFLMVSWKIYLGILIENVNSHMIALGNQSTAFNSRRHILAQHILARHIILHLPLASECMRLHV
jgi:hypothetical protein